MATLQALIPYLEKQYVLQNVRGESLRMVAPNKVEWIRSRGYRFEQEFVSLAEVRNMHDVWDWQVLERATDG
jgi:hypothetical protein